MLNLFFYFCESYHCNFDRDLIEFVDHFEQHRHFSNINFLIREHRISFHLFMTYSIFSSVSYSFQCTDLSLHLNVFLSVLLFLMVWIAVHVSFSESLSLVRKPTDFCILVLYPVAILYLFIVLTDFLMKS